MEDIMNSQTNDSANKGNDEVAQSWKDVINAAKLAQKRRANKGPEYPERALFCLPLSNPIRKLAIFIAESKYACSCLQFFSW